MVTKQDMGGNRYWQGSVLAKIHMVTKLDALVPVNLISSVLAKIHMVTKPIYRHLKFTMCSVLAKIHMVTKLRA